MVAAQFAYLAFVARILPATIRKVEFVMFGIDPIQAAVPVDIGANTAGR